MSTLSTFNSISNTNVSRSTIDSLNSSSNVTNVYVLTGYISPTTVGVYPVYNSSGTQLTLARGSIVLGVTLQPAVNLVGGTSVEVGFSSTTGGVIAQTITGVQTIANINATAVVQPAIGATAPTASPYIVANTIGVNTAGQVKINILYINPLI